MRNAVRDAENFVEVLTTRYAFYGSDVIFLKDKSATRENIIGILDELVDRISKQDSLIIYFSGHGFANPRTKRGAWVPVDAHPDTPSEYISNSTIIDYIKDIPSLHTFLVSDSCFSGKLFAQYRDLGTQGHYHKIYQHPSRWGFSSGGDEVVADGHWGGNSPFATQLLNFLRSNTDPLVSVSELITHVQKAVGINHVQQPIGNRIYNVGDTGQGSLSFNSKMPKVCSAYQPIKASKYCKQPIITYQLPAVSTPAFSAIKWIYGLLPALIVLALGIIFLPDMIKSTNAADEMARDSMMFSLSADSTTEKVNRISSPQKSPAISGRSNSEQEADDKSQTQASGNHVEPSAEKKSGSPNMLNSEKPIDSPKVYLEVKLLVNASHSDANITVDGQAALIIEDTPIIKTIRVEKKSSNHLIKLDNGDRPCSKNVFIQENGQTITINC